ncbi:hypothetical protein GCM10017776_25180 [Streptomyces griseoluteus]|nr:hypothetical protein GCM10017776_25180 [Streptomyces griseoluteus]
MPLFCGFLESRKGKTSRPGAAPRGAANLKAPHRCLAADRHGLAADAARFSSNPYKQGVNSELSKTNPIRPDRRRLQKGDKFGRLEVLEILRADRVRVQCDAARSRR